MNKIDDIIMDDILENMPYIEGAKNKWIQADGDSLMMRRMDATHLCNAIKKVKKDIEKWRDVISDEVLEKAEEKLEELTEEYTSRA